MVKNISLIQALDQVGKDGRYQVLTFVTFGFLFFAQVFTLLSPTYIFLSPPLVCNNNASIVCLDNHDTCKNYNISFDESYHHKTLVTEFNLICGKDILVTYATSSMFVGTILGSLLFSYLGDLKGRKLAIRLAWLCNMIGVVGINFTFDMYWYIVFDIIAGFGMSGAAVMAIIIINEVSGNQFRQRASVGFMIVYGVGEILCAFIFFIFLDWRIVWILFMSIPIIVGFILCLFVQESPKYYISILEFEKAYDVLDYIAHVNRKPKFDRSQILILQIDKEIITDEIPVDISLNFIGNAQKQNCDEDRKPKYIQYNYYDLFKYKSLRTNTLGLMGMIFCLQIIYFGGQYSVNQISTGDFAYTIGAMFGVAELLGYILAILYVEKLPRRMTMLVTQIASLVIMLFFLGFGFNNASVDIPTGCELCKKAILIIIPCSIIRILNSIAYGIQALYTAELYPTVIRSIGSGYINAFGLIGALISPYAFPIATALNINPYIVIIFFSLIGPFAIVFIKETLDVPMQDEIEELIGTNLNEITGSSQYSVQN